MKFSIWLIAGAAFIYVGGVFWAASFIEEINSDAVGYVAVRTLKPHTRVDDSFVKPVPRVIPMGYFRLLQNVNEKIVGRYTTSTISVGEKIDPSTLADTPQLSIAAINTSILLPLTDVFDLRYINAEASVVLKLADGSVLPATVATIVCAKAAVVPVEKKNDVKDISCKAVLQVPEYKVDNLRKQTGIGFSLASLPKP